MMAGGMTPMIEPPMLEIAGLRAGHGAVTVRGVQQD